MSTTQCVVRRHRSAGYPAVAVESPDETRCLAAIVAECSDAAGVWHVTAQAGLRDLRTGQTLDPAVTTPKAMSMASERENIVLVVSDWHHVSRNPVAYRSLLAVLPALKMRGSLVVFVAPSWKLPPELEHEMPVLPHGLPTRADLRASLDVVVDSAGLSVTDEQAEHVLDAAAGLTLSEAESSMALAVTADSTAIDAEVVTAEKMRLVKQAGYLEVWPTVPLDSVGGLDRLRTYVAQEVMPVRDDAQLRVRGIMLVGVPGTGKSLAARAIASEMGYPVLKLDVGGLKGSLVGQSEGNMKAALKLAEAVAPCVLWLDEIEKGVGGFASSSQTDGGTTLGMVGQLLTWLQEHRHPIITVATCNDFKLLPPALTRAGRFDERFFVDLPHKAERIAIAGIHLRRFGCAEALVVDLAEKIAGWTNAWTGAEIEQLVKSAARQTMRGFAADVVESCSWVIKPLSKTCAGEIEALRTWAKDSMRMANMPEVGETEKKPTRRVKGGLN